MPMPTTLDRACALDPRITDLLAAAAAELMQRTDGPHHVYSDAKPYLASFVGWGRHRPPAANPVNPSSGRRFQRVTDRPSPRLAVEDEAFLASEYVYSEAINYLSWNLARIDEQMTRSTEEAWW